MLRGLTVRAHAPAGNAPPAPPPPSSPPSSLHPTTSPVSVSSSAAVLKPGNRLAMSRHVRIAVVGDVHDDWDSEEDAKALHFLQKIDEIVKEFTSYVENNHGIEIASVSFSVNIVVPDLSPLFNICDFGNENVDLVKSIANLNLPKAAILGNHDSWYTSQFSRKKADRVQLQLECLGEQHVGYHRLDFPLLKLSVVGGRPFSCGGNRMFRERLLSMRYGVHDMDGSAKKIFEAALGAPEGHSLVLLAHNGPTGLGSQMNDICGRDWVYGGGDHGDPDLAQAIAELKKDTQISIPLVVFGHMHKDLAYGNGLRKMLVVGDDDTVYLNGAIVPRVRTPGRQESCSRIPWEDPNLVAGTLTLRAFTLVETQGGTLQKISETWVSVHGNKTTVAEENVLFKRP